VAAGRTDADDLANAAMKMVERATLERLANPSARIDVRLAADFLDQLNKR
jgi:hypothetical protein